jgi:hypothetical protein
VHEQAAVLDPSLVEAIEAAIKGSTDEWNKFVGTNRVPAFEGDTQLFPLVMKYQPSERATGCLPQENPPFLPPYPDPFPPPYPLLPSSPNKGFWIGKKDYTWGKAVYVTGIKEPLSTATYGRVGLVSYFDPSKIQRVFDARDQPKFDLYLQWLHCQPIYPRAVLTVHTNHWLHGLRNDFRTQFRIDVVMCNADEHDVGQWYTDPADTWLCVGDFEPDPEKPGQDRLKENYSNVFPDVRLTVVIEDEFPTPNPDPPPRPPAWPPARVHQLAVSRKPPLVPSMPDIAKAYWQGQILRVQS